MNTWTEAKFPKPPTPVPISDDVVAPVIPASCKRDHIYRTFDLFVLDSLFGGITGHAVNRELDIRLEQRFPSQNQWGDAPAVRLMMRSKVDDVIVQHALEIPPHTEPVPKQEMSASEFSRQVQRRYEAERKIKRMNQSFTFDACSGTQGTNLLFTAVIEFAQVVEMFHIDVKKQSLDERYCRVPSGLRVNRLASYITSNQNSYIIPSLTCSIEGDYEFKEYAPHSSAGKLTIKPGAKLHLLDGSHRKCAIFKVVEELAKLGKEGIPVTFILDRGIKRRRQWFTDINLNAQKLQKHYPWTTTDAVVGST
jgi:hypothetical protein